MRSRSIVQRFAFVSLMVVVGVPLLAQTEPADKSRLDKARKYLKLAQDHLARSTNPMLADMGRGDVCLAQAALGDLAVAKKSASVIDFDKAQVQTDIARVEARTDKPSALQYLQSLASNSPSDADALATVAEAQADLGEFEGAAKVASGMKPSWQQASIYMAVARAQAKAGDLPAATKTFAAAKAALKNDADRFPRLRPGTIACAQLEAGDAASARQTAGAIVAPEEKGMAFAALARIAAKKSDKAAARELLELARQALTDNQGAPGTLIDLARAANAAGFKESSKTFLAQARARADAIEASSEERPEALASVAIAQLAMGDVAGSTDTMTVAMTAVDKVTNAGNRTHAFWVIAGSQASARDIEGVRQTLALAMKGRIDPAETSMQAASVARGLARAAHERADLGWIAQLGTDEEKGLAYAAAAAGMVEMSGED